MGGGEAFAEKVLLSMHSGQSDDMGLVFQGRASFLKRKLRYINLICMVAFEKNSQMVGFD